MNLITLHAQRQTLCMVVLTIPLTTVDGLVLQLMEPTGSVIRVIVLTLEYYLRDHTVLQLVLLNRGNGHRALRLPSSPLVQ